IAMAIRMRHLAEALVAQGFETTVYTSTKLRSDDINIKRVVNRISPPSNMDNLIIRLFKEILYGIETFLRLLFSNKDVYIVTSPPFIASIISCIALMLRGKPFVFDVRDEY